MACYVPTNENVARVDDMDMKLFGMYLPQSPVTYPTQVRTSANCQTHVLNLKDAR